MRVPILYPTLALLVGVLTRAGVACDSSATAPEGGSGGGTGLSSPSGGSDAGQGGGAAGHGGGTGAQAGQAGHAGHGDGGSAGGGAHGGAGGAGGAAGAGGSAGQGGSGGAELRVMAANLTSGSSQDYDLGHGIRIFQGLDPDIVLIQEFNYRSNSSSDLRDFVDLAFGPGFSYTRESGKAIPNGVISRYQMIDSGVWNDPETTDREIVWARIDLPGETELWAVSVHFLTTSASERANEAEALLDAMAGVVPSGALVVLGGDFNTGSRGETCIEVLDARFVTSGPYPRDNDGNENTNASREEPYDWVLANPALDTLEVPVLIGSQSFSNGLVFDSRVYTPLSDVSPVQEGDSGAPYMQHMAVVRDFVVP